MSKLIGPRNFVILVHKEILDNLLEVSGEDSFGLLLEDYYQCAFNPQYYIAELSDMQSEYIERDISIIYLITGAIALHEVDTAGVFIDYVELESVNDVFGFDGGGAALLYSMLNGSERLELIRGTVEKNHPYLLSDEVFVKTVPIEEVPNNNNPTFEYDESAFEYDEDWEELDEFYDTFSNDCYECRSADRMLLFQFGAGTEGAAKMIATSGMQCYIFDLDKELYSENEIEILDLGAPIKIDPNTGEVIEKPNLLLPAPPSTPEELLAKQYNNGLITKNEYDDKLDALINRKAKLNHQSSEALVNPHYNFKDKDASEITRELQDAWSHFGTEDEYYGKD